MLVPPQLFVSETVIVRHSAPRMATEVVVTFESAHGGIDRVDPLRLAWGEKFLVENGYAVVGFLPRDEASWYRHQDVFDIVTSDWLQKLIRNYERVHTYGSSMGGYGACTFARALGAENVVAIAPISTLAEDIAPWERRFKKAMVFDWKGEFRDAAQGVTEDMSVYLLYDEQCVDARHAERIAEAAGRGARPIRVGSVKHGVAVKLAAKGLLKPVTLECLRGTDPDEIAAFISERMEKHSAAG